ncbi:Complete genome; segment 2/17 (fragment) [Xenorhabdus nematophila ATCC 19061]|uniref:Complete genome segment 2/17 n=1 Tax=Xenorhabdus nematophila (strain ATCC 19061 / DSM 3370 / CCUG 14189 / LMG 1036 / NCIMB 9965 / AN6) TaxID=406817 RepID=D3VJU7_XENNA
MNFFSFEFLGSFVILLVVYWLLQKAPKLQNGLLILVSYLYSLLQLNLPIFYSPIRSLFTFWQIFLVVIYPIKSFLLS